MVAVARSFGTKIMFVTPVINLKDISPFKSQNSDGLTGAERVRWENLYESGKSLLQSGKYGKAVSTFQQALAIDSHHAALHFRLGLALFKLQRFGEAKESFQRAVDEDICPLRILTPMRKTLRSITKKKRVPLVDFWTILEKTYTREYGHTIFGKEYFVDHVHLTYQGYRLLALAILDDMERQGTVKPTSAWNDEAIKNVTKKMVKQLDSKIIAESLLNQGRVMAWAGKFKAARTLFLRSYNLSKDKEPLMRLGTVSVLMENLTEAIRYFQMVLQTTPDYPNAHYALALIYKDQGQVEKALKHIKKCVEIMPDNAKFHYELGLLLRDSNKNDTALYHLKEVVKIEPDTTKGRRSQAIIYDLTGHIDKAVSEYENLLKINPDLAGVHNDFGILLASIGEIEKAEQHFRREIQLNPASDSAEFNLARALQLQGKTRQAIDHYEKAIAINPNSIAAKSNLGMLRAQQEKTKKPEETKGIEQTAP
ncbi:MAG: tetratricopeptide repeat protein [Proteobacteria bacterium]|nr:tetratricopeptide repeat protein [Pseudomonadota bacterium]MBU1714040.1 tetratricopeptide repeat protein [Pseudomonadota bacterium]